MSENDALSEEEYGSLRKERQKLIRKKWLEVGVTNFPAGEQDKLDGLTKKLYQHWRATAPPPKSYPCSPYWQECTICGIKHKNEEEHRDHWMTCEIRRLDNEIAEKAMGWVLDEDDLGNRYWAGSWLDYDRRGYSEHTCMDSFEPAKSMSHAYWVMKELTKKGWEFDLSSYGTRNVIHAYNSKADVAGGYEGEAGLPEAVCRAVLKALDNMKKE